MLCCLQKVSGPAVQYHEEWAGVGVYLGLSPNGGLTCLVNDRNQHYLASHVSVLPWNWKGVTLSHDP